MAEKHNANLASFLSLNLKEFLRVQQTRLVHYRRQFARYQIGPFKIFKCCRVLKMGKFAFEIYLQLNFAFLVAPNAKFVFGEISENVVR